MSLDQVKRAASALETCNDMVLGAVKYIIIAVVGVIAVVMMASVFWRYVLDNSIPWSEEACKYLMVWLAFLGAPIALRHGNHVNIDLLINAFPARGQQVFLFLVNAIIVITMGIVFWKGIGFVELGARQVASSFNLSMLYMYIAVPIGSALTVLVALEHNLRAFVGIFEPENGLHIDHAALANEVGE